MPETMLLKAFRDEKLLLALRRFVGAKLGRAFPEVSAISMLEVYRDTDAKTRSSSCCRPDEPAAALCRRDVISLGQGQGQKAAALIQRRLLSGCWCLLLKCHLAKSWMPQLEKIVEGSARARTS
jgi:dynein heavy chain